MTLVSPRQWASGDDEPSRSAWGRRPADDLFSELLDELAAELLADDKSADSAPDVDSAEADTAVAHTVVTDTVVSHTVVTHLGADENGIGTADSKSGAETTAASPVDADRVEFVAEAARPASQIFVDDQRRGRRLVSMMLTVLKLAVMIYATVVAVGFIDLLSR